MPENIFKRMGSVISTRISTLTAGIQEQFTTIQQQLDSFQHTDNNYTTVEKNKLAGIESEANKYVLPTASGTVTGGVRVDGITTDVVDGYLTALPTSWTNIQSKPTTIAGYGITDAFSTAGDTLTGRLTLDLNSYIKKISPNGIAYFMTADGTGNQHWYWNTAGGVSPIFGMSSETASDIMHTNGGFYFRAADGTGKSSGDPIVWTNVLRASLDGSFQFKGNDVWHSGNLNNLSQLANGPGYITNTTQTLNAGDLVVTQSILPSTNSTIDIGSPSARFKTIYVDEARLSVNTLYIGDTPIIGTSQDTINIKADPGQSINIATQGVGTTLVTSVKGVSVETTGMNADVVVQASGTGSKVRIGATSSVDISAPLDITNTLNVTGHTTVSSLTVNGNLTINGTNTLVNSTTVTTKDNIILLNQGELGAGVTSGKSGIQVDRGEEADYQILFDETDDLFKVGMVGNLEAIASRPWVTTNFSDISHSHNAATTTTSGFLSATDKTKLDSLSNYTHPTSGVVAGTYNSVTVDANGHVTGGTTPTTLAGYGITDGALSTHNHTLDSLSNVTTLGKATNDLLQWNGAAWVNKTIAAAGLQPAGAYLTANQNITVSGDVSGSGTTAITLTLPNTGVTAGSYGNATTIPSITIDAKGRITSVSTNAVSIPSGTISVTGGDFIMSGTTGVAITNATLVNSGVTAGTYKSVTVDVKGRVTAGTNPTTIAGYGITDAVVSNTAITAGTGTKITYDAKGLITSSTTLTAADIPNLDGSKITTGLLGADRVSATYTESMRANSSITGGGNITVNSSGYVLWSARFLTVSNGRGTNFSTSGYFDINCPTSGTITGVGGAVNVTATAAGIPLAAWHSLYYILPIGSSNTSVPANFRIVTYSADLDIPYNWILICSRNGDNDVFYFNNGLKLYLNSTSSDVIDSAPSTDTGEFTIASGASTALTKSNFTIFNGKSNMNFLNSVVQLKVKDGTDYLLDSTAIIAKVNSTGSTLTLTNNFNASLVVHVTVLM